MKLEVGMKQKNIVFNLLDQSFSTEYLALSFQLTKHLV